MDTITILHSPNCRLNKRVLADGTVEGFANAKHYDFYSETLTGLDDLEDLLCRLTTFDNVCVVRGEIVDPENTKARRRLLYDQEGHSATLRPVPRLWVALDLDSVERPESVPAADLEACARLAIATLPEPFQGAACLVQASGSHGVKPGCRLRLWFWLSTALGKEALETWLPMTDLSVYRAAQAIYVCPPTFVGISDHLPVRMIRLPGRDLVEVPPEIEGMVAGLAVVRASPARARRAAVAVADAPEPETELFRAGSAAVSAGIAEAMAKVAKAGLPWATRFKLSRIEAMTAEAVGRCLRAKEGEKRDVLFKQARALGGVLHTGLLSERDAVAALWAGVEARANCRATAMETIADGLEAGRAKPIYLKEPERPDVEISGLLRRPVAESATPEKCRNAH